MKKFLILGVCIVLAAAVTASAAIIPVGEVIATRTSPAPSFAGYDRLDFTLTSTGWPVGQKLNGLEGIFTVTGGSMYLGINDEDPDPPYLPIAGSWKAYSARVAGTTNPTGPSYVNFRSLINGSVWSRTGDPNVDHLSTSLQGGWFTDAEADKLYPTGSATNQRLARLWVTPGAEVTYTGQLGFSGSIVQVGSFTSIVPEPGTLALLATGLVGLLAYAWRKRK